MSVTLEDPLTCEMIETEIWLNIYFISLIIDGTLTLIHWNFVEGPVLEFDWTLNTKEDLFMTTNFAHQNGLGLGTVFVYQKNHNNRDVCLCSNITENIWNCSSVIISKV